MPRVRELGICLGELPVGPWNAITDVPGVRVGHYTLISEDGELSPGRGPVRTGVSVVLPHPGNVYLEKVSAAVHTINGYGKATGFEQVRELGVLESPIALTNTLNVGLVMDALVGYALEQTPELGIRSDYGSINVVVGETNDGYLNDIRGRHVRTEHVRSALDQAASGPVAEGAVGAGTGTVCFGWKGGIGTASRRLANRCTGFTVGCLVQTNFGRRRDFILDGIAVGRRLEKEPGTSVGDSHTGGGSVVVIVATDAPLDSRQLGRICRRAVAGLARVGANLSHGSGDFVISFSTAERIPHSPERTFGNRSGLINDGNGMDDFFRATIESVEEAVLNSLFMAETVVGRDGHTADRLPVEKAVDLWQAGHPKE